MKAMLKNISLVAAAILVCSTQPAIALPFGFGCCCPSPSGCIPCGIVPCDSGCAGAALNQMGVSISQAFTQLNASYQTRNQNLQTAIQNLSSMQANIVSNLQQLQRNPTTGVLNALEGFTSRIEAEYLRNTKAMTNLSDSFQSSVIDAMKTAQQVELKIQNDKQFGEIAQPVSGDIGVDMAPQLKADHVARRQLSKAMISESAEYNNSLDANLVAMSNRYVRSLAEQDDANFTPSPLVNKHQIDIGSEENLKRLILVMSNQNPLAPLTTSAGQNNAAAEYELNRKIWNSQMLMAQAPLIQQLMKKTQLINPAEWRSGYAEESNIGDGNKVSFDEAMRAEIDGRLSTPGWYQDIASMPEAGLYREMNYMDSIGNKLLYEMLSNSTSENRLIGLKNIVLLNESKPTGSN